MFIDYEYMQLSISLFLLASIVLFATSIALGHTTTIVHRILFAISAVLFLMTAGSFTVQSSGLLTVGIVVILLFHAINALRGTYARYIPKRLHKRLGASWWRLSALMVVVFLIDSYVSQPFEYFILSCFVFSLIFLLTTFKNLFQYKLRMSNGGLREWPTVSLVIPARNEDHALHDALSAALKIDYPKLEIIVLDDCSHDKTPDIIASHAHDGVRFVSGEQPEAGWTGKNQALQKLLDEASGEYILFADVDIHFGSSSLVQLMSGMIDKKLAMLSVLPGRRHFDFSTSLFASLQDLFMIGAPLDFFGQPPASGVCMLFDTEKLRRLGGFGIVSDMVGPEFYFARQFSRRQGYTMVLGTQSLDITTRKKLSSTLDTRNRVLYPVLEKDPAAVLLVSILIVGLFIGNIFAAFQGNFIAALTTVFLISSHLAVVTVLNPTAWLLSVINLPLVALVDVLLTLKSMLSYEFGTVRWKKRNICYVSLETIPKLPDLPVKSSKARGR